MIFRKRRDSRATADTESPSPQEETGGGNSRDEEKPPTKFAKLLEKLQRSRPMRANTILNDQGGAVLAAGMSFQALFAVFAGLWLAFSIFGFVLRDNERLLNTILKQLNTMMPGLVGDKGVVKVDTLLASGSALTWTSAIAAVSLLMLVITWFTSTRTAIRLICDLETVSYENPVLLKLRDLGLALFFGVLILLSAVITIASSSVLTLVLKGLGFGEDFWLFGWAGWLLRGAIMFCTYWFLLWAIHRILAGVPLRGKSLWIGTFPGAVGLFVLTLLGSSLLGGASKNPLLASFAVLIGLLLWFNFICRVLLLTSAWIAAGLDRDRGLPPKLEEKDRAERERMRAIANAGVDPGEAKDLDMSLLEHSARVHRHDD